VKNPDYPDTMYVTELVAPGVVSTMPAAILDDFADHGIVLDGIVRGQTARPGTHLVTSANSYPLSRRLMPVSTVAERVPVTNNDTDSARSRGFVAMTCETEAQTVPAPEWPMPSKPGKPGLPDPEPEPTGPGPTFPPPPEPEPDERPGRPVPPAPL
jgi:hypothetical protein